MACEEALDASPFCSDNQGSEKAAGKDLKQSRMMFARDFVHLLQRNGFVRLRGHGISATNISQVFQAVGIQSSHNVEALAIHKTFFDLPLQRKQELRYSGGATPARGFTPSHTEKTFLHKPHLSQAAPDAAETREQFTIGPPEDFKFPTPWLQDTDLASCHDDLYSFHKICRLVALKLTQAIELGLGLQEGTITKHYVPDASELTLNWYPEAPRAALQGSSLKRIWPHSDLGIISLLFQDGIGGLEFENRESNGQFVPVQPTTSTEMIVNASDNLERWTNGVIQAGIHRVAAPSTMQLGHNQKTVPGRRSVVLLYRAKGETSVGPLPDFVKPDRPAMFDEMTATEYLTLKNKLTFGNVRAQEVQ